MQLEIRRTQQAYCDFVEGLKAHVAEKLTPELKAIYEERSSAWAAARGGKKPETIEEVAAVLEPTVPYWYRSGLQRISQEMMWAAVSELLEPHREELRRQLEGAPEEALGKLELDPALPLPGYYTDVQFHLQPGSFFGDELAGVVYDLAVPIYVLHRYGPENDEMGRALISALSGKHRRILDMGCGIGQKTLPFVDAFPGAQVSAIDLAAPMLRYAHLRAERWGKPVAFSQQNAEATRFSEGSFDLVFSTILLHELPEYAIRNVIAESYRVLEKGGVCAHLDLPPYRTQVPYNAFLMDWDTDHNNEPYWRAFHQMDLPAVYRQAGFANVREVPVKSQWSGKGGFYTGEFTYWVTMGERQ